MNPVAADQPTHGSTRRDGTGGGAHPSQDGPPPTLHLYAPVNQFLALLLDWSLPDIVEPMPGHHGAYSIMLWRPA